MTTGFRYRFGKAMGGLLVFFYLVAILVLLAGLYAGAQFHFGQQFLFSGFVALIVSGFFLWFVPRPLDLVLLSPLAVYGWVMGWGLTWTVASLGVALPVVIVVILSLGRREN